MEYIASLATACSKATCIVDADRMATSYVRDSLQADRVFNEVITFTVPGRDTRDMHCGMRECGVRRELCRERLGSVRSIYRARLVSRSARVESSTGPRGAPRANHSRGVAPPLRGVGVFAMDGAATEGAARRMPASHPTPKKSSSAARPRTASHQASLLYRL